VSITPYQQANGVADLAPLPTPQQQVSAVAQLVEWAHGAQAAHEVAVNLVGTSFCPQHYRGKPEEATAAILAGLEVGLQPMAALQAFVPIQGSAAAKAITLRAIVQSHGHELWIEESTETRVVVAGRRKGSAQVQRSVWTIERAAQMKLTGRDQWKVQPTAMLIARATSECARLIASDAILGIPYSVEELEDGGPAPVQAIAEQVTPPAARRRNPVSTLPTMPVQDAPASAGPPVGHDTPIDPKGAQMKRMQILLKERVGTHREAVLDFVSGTVGREIGSSKDLMYAEAAKVIDALEQLPAAPSAGEDGSTS
jgi:hypothetical protein